jgi:Mce-associated membrane protein
VTSEAGTRPPGDAAEDERLDAASEEPRGGSADGATADAANGGDSTGRDRPRLSLPLVPVLGVLLVLLLAAAAFLWFTRPDPSSVRTGDYVEALQAARSGVVDLTSFDHLTLEDDIEQIRRVATGTLREEAIARLEDNRDSLVESEAIVNTEVIGAGVTRATGSAATVLLVIESTQESTVSQQAQVLRYRIEVELTKQDDRWLLSGITGR